jgi:hypothetical protein
VPGREVDVALDVLGRRAVREVGGGGPLRLAFVDLPPHPDVLARPDPRRVAVADRARVVEVECERGLDQVPGGVDLSIVGFDDTAPEAEGLTSIHQPLRDKGRIAAELLLGDASAGSELLPTRLVVRESTAKPPDAAQGVGT